MPTIGKVRLSTDMSAPISPVLGDEEPGSGGSVGGGSRAVGSACNGCRRSKLRCSREKPVCRHCRKTGESVLNVW